MNILLHRRQLLKSTLLKGDDFAVFNDALLDVDGFLQNFISAICVVIKDVFQIRHYSFANLIRGIPIKEAGAMIDAIIDNLSNVKNRFTE